MTFQFSDFEDQPVGDVPDGWNITETSGDYTIEVSDQNPIEGSKSFLMWDSGTYQIEASHPVGDETIRFAASINQDESFRGNWVGAEYRVEDPNGSVLWSYTIGRFSDSGDFEIRYSTSRQNPENNPGSEGSLVGTVEPGFHNIVFEDPLNGLKLRIDEAVVHDTGTEFSNAADFYIWEDDYKGIYDKGAIDSSQFVLLLSSETGLRGGVISAGDRCVLYDESVGRAEKPSSPDDLAAVVADDLGQS